MSRYIDADKLKKRLVKMYWQNEEKQGVYDPYVKAIEKCVDILDNQPTADAEKVRHGKWVRNACMDDIYWSYYKCSECEREIKIPYGNTEELIINFPYCHCGAKMDNECI